MGVAHAFLCVGEVEIQAGEIARIGVIAEAHVDTVRTVVHGCFQCRQAASGHTSSILSGCIQYFLFQYPVDPGHSSQAPLAVATLGQFTFDAVEHIHFCEHHSGASRISFAAVPVTRWNTICSGVRSIKSAAMRIYSSRNNGRYSPRRIDWQARCALPHAADGASSHPRRYPAPCRGWRGNEIHLPREAEDQVGT